MHRPRRLYRLALLLPLFLPLWGAALGCRARAHAADAAHAANAANAANAAQPANTENGTPQVAGEWRAVLASPGGELPFGLRLTRTGRGLRAVAENGPEQAPFSSVAQSGTRLTLRIDWYDSRIDAEVSPRGDRMTGVWTRTEPGGPARIPFAAVRGKSPRFTRAATSGGAGAAPAALPSVSGQWSAEFKDADGVSPAQGEFRQEGERVTGTFLTPTGDYRYLEGSYEGGLLRLSTFDGAHAFLFTAHGKDDGTLQGDFWSRDRYHATWTARRVAAGQPVLPDAWAQVGLTNKEGRFGFRFPGLDGHAVSLADPRFAGKVVLVNVFGSWCPNCNDEAPVLAGWYRRYHDRGLEIVGLAYEYTGDPARDARFVRKYAARHGITYPLLLAGTADKKAAAKTLPDLTAVVAFPTSIFLGRDGRVRKIYTGYAGPGTGEHHLELVGELERLIESLLKEPAPGAAHAAG